MALQPVQERLLTRSLAPLQDMEGLRRLLDPVVEVSTDASPDVSLGTTILIGGRPSKEDIEACPHLRMLIIPYAGVPASTRELMLEYPNIAVHNLHHNAAAAAELAVGLLLAAAKRLIPADRALRRGDWSIRYSESGDIQLGGKTALILGYGAVGSRIGRVCRALGMRVIGVRRRPDARFASDEAAEIAGTDGLLELLPQANVLVVSVPMTHETQDLIGEREFSLLPNRAVLVNIARGPVVDEAALFDALKDGTIGAAGLDVWYRYPRDESERVSTLPSEYPFHQLENVVLSPHRGGAFNRAELEALRVEHLARLLNAAARGEPVPNRVDVEAGY